MNKKFLVLFSVLLSVLVFGSCKPKQSAYKSVYEAAKEKEEIVEEEVDTYTYEPVSRPRPTTPTSPSSDASVRKEKVTLVNSNDASGLKAYSVVIAAMGMKPNAESLKKKIEDAGYKVILVQNDQGMYRVIIASCDTKEEADARRTEILDDFYSQGTQESLKAKYGIPFNDWWILQRTY